MSAFLFVLVSSTQSSYSKGSAKCGCSHDYFQRCCGFGSRGWTRVGASSGDAGGGGTRRSREERGSSGAASENAAELQPPKKRSKRCQQRKALGFAVEYLAKFGLQVDGRDASSGAVTSGSCRFCRRFGREAQPELLAAGKRGPVSSVKHFGKPWRTDAFLQRLRKQHREKWKENKASDVAAREKFFEVSRDDVAHISTLDAHLDTGESLFFWVRRNIVNRVIGNLLFDPTESDEKVEAALRIFKEDGVGEARGVSSEQSEMKVTVRKVLAFSLVIDYVGAGLSFRKASTVMSSTAERTELGKLKGVRENEVVKFVRAVIGVNLQLLSDLLNNRECWAFSLTFDGATVQGRSLLDVRVRLCLRGGIEDVHLLAIPLRESHTGLQMSNLVDNLMTELCSSEWKGKFIGIVTDGARNMTGRHSCAVTRLASGALPGFYRIWCASHQLDHVIQELMSGLCGETFYGTLTSCISHLRRQQNLVSSMKKNCPKVASTRWLSLGRVCNWLGKHRYTIFDHFEAKTPASAPPPMWWILLLSVQAFIKPVDICFKSMQGLKTVISEQYEMLRNMVTNLKLLLQVEGPLSAEDVTTRSADVECVTRESYFTTRVCIRNFVADLGQFALVRWRALSGNEKRELEEGIGLLFLSAIESILNIAAERDSTSEIMSDKIPPVIPRELARFHRGNSTR